MSTIRQLLATSVAAVGLVASAAPIAAPIAAASPAAPAASTVPSGVTAVTTIEGVSEYRLPNGLQVLLYPDPSRPTATVNITYHVGSRQERYGETGMAHLLEHLIFKGSTKYPKPERDFAARGFHNNGSTGEDRTNYFSTFDASDSNMRWAIDWSADAMVHSFIARRDLDSEMTVVRNEYEKGENDPFNVLYKRMFAVAYDWHNYGHVPIGNRSDIENVAIPNLRAFYRTYYQPDNATLIVSGRFEPARVLRWIVASFGAIPRPQRALPVLWTVEPTQDGERSVVVRRKGDVQIVALAYHVPAALSDDGARLGLAADILGDTPSGRLHKALVETGMAAQVFAFPADRHDPGLMMFGAVVNKGAALDAVRDRLIGVVESTFAQEPPSGEEMKRAQTDTATEYERALTDAGGFGVELSEYIGQGDWRIFFASRDKALAAGSSDVAVAAQKYFRRDNRTVGMFIPTDDPQRADIPAPLAVGDYLRDYKPREAVSGGEAFDPSQDNIDRRTRRLAYGDLKLALLPKKTRGGLVNVSLAFRFGDERNLRDKAIVERMTQAMLGRGTSTMTRQQIADEMTRLRMTGGLTAFQVPRDQLPDALRLVAGVLRDANFPAPEFEQLKNETLTSLQSELGDPAARSGDAIALHFNTYPAGDPRDHLSLDDQIAQIEKLRLEDVQQFYRDYWGTARGQVGIVGDFDADAVAPMVRDLFAGWKSPASYAPILAEPRDVPATRIVIDTPDKENAVYRARINVAIRDDDPDAAALDLANAIFGGGAGLSNRLAERVRQKEGLSYGIGSSLQPGVRDRAGSWQVSAIAAPQNVGRVEAAVKEELERALKEGFSAQEVTEARDGMLQQRQMLRSSDPRLAALWVNYLDLDRTFAFSTQYEERLRRLEASDVVAAMRRYLDPAKMTVVIAGDRRKGVQ
ncbi:MAG TPA: pitrilysin family protein [Burkholderiaceae bacterium]|nr:pitrilysin family protein [Burkholderiaceae bacterium]